MDVAIENSDLLDDLLEMYSALLKENLLLKRVITKLTTGQNTTVTMGDPVEEAKNTEALAMVSPDQ